MNNTTIINTFNCDDSNIANIKTQHGQVMTTITNRILKFKPKIKKKNDSRQSILYCYYFSRDQFFCLNQFYHNKKFVKRVYQNQKTNLHKFKKDCHQDNLSFACLQFYKYNYLNIVAGINSLS